MDEIWLARVTHLPPVLEGREDVRPPQQLDGGVGGVSPDFLQKVLETNHEFRCLSSWTSFFGTPPRSVRGLNPPGACNQLAHVNLALAGALRGMAPRVWWKSPAAP